jgi:ELWxxDGT repeat protein
VNGTLYFSANDGTNGSELWKSDGTSNGTVMVKDIRAGAASSNPILFTSFKNMLFFASTDDFGTNQLYSSNGTSAGTTRIVSPTITELGTITLVIRDYSSTVVSTQVVDLNSLTNRLTYIDEWSNFWVEIWATSAISAGISAFSTTLNFNANVFEVRAGAVNNNKTDVVAGSAVSNLTHTINAGSITLTGSVSGTQGANTNNVMLARVAFMPVDGAVSSSTETKGILLNYASNTGYIKPIANGFALDASKSTVTTSSGTRGTPNSTMLGTVPLFPVIYDYNDDGAINARDFTQFVRAFIAGSVTSPSTLAYARLFDYNLDGTVNAQDFTQFTRNFANSISRDACRANPLLKVAYPNAFVQVAIPAGAAAMQQMSLMTELEDDMLAPIAKTIVPAMLQTSSSQSAENLALLAYMDSQETKNDDLDIDILNPASETERLIAEGKL